MKLPHNQRTAAAVGRVGLVYNQHAAQLNPRAAGAQQTVTRKDFTDRLGLPEDANNQTVFAALDAHLATKRRRAQAKASSPALDALYNAAWGKSDAAWPAAAAPPEDLEALYVLAFGGGN